MICVLQLLKARYRPPLPTKYNVENQVKLQVLHLIHTVWGWGRRYAGEVVSRWDENEKMRLPLGQAVT